MTRKQIVARVPIERFVGMYVPLHRRRLSHSFLRKLYICIRHGVPFAMFNPLYIGVCPFHDGDAEPTIMLDKLVQDTFVVRTAPHTMFRCMAPCCGATGDVVDFLMQYEDIDEHEAIDRLAEFDRSFKAK